MLARQGAQERPLERGLARVQEQVQQGQMEPRLARLAEAVVAEVWVGLVEMRPPRVRHKKYKATPKQPNRRVEYRASFSAYPVADRL